MGLHESAVLDGVPRNLFFSETKAAGFERVAHNFDHFCLSGSGVLFYIVKSCLIFPSHTSNLVAEGIVHVIHKIVIDRVILICPLFFGLRGEIFPGSGGEDALSD